MNRFWAGKRSHRLTLVHHSQYTVRVRTLLTRTSPSNNCEMFDQTLVGGRRKALKPLCRTVVPPFPYTRAFETIRPNQSACCALAHLHSFTRTSPAPPAQRERRGGAVGLQYSTVYPQCGRRRSRAAWAIFRPAAILYVMYCCSQKSKIECSKLEAKSKLRVLQKDAGR
jgi:hypothetical protein